MGKQLVSLSAMANVSEQFPPHAPDTSGTQQNAPGTPVDSLELSLSQLVVSSPSSENATKEECNKSSSKLGRRRSVSQGRHRAGDSSCDLKKSVPLQNSG
jgi:hypothetical protein